MPKEHKKRGRRDDQKKRKRDQDDDASAKRFKKEDLDQLEAEQRAARGQFAERFAEFASKDQRRLVRRTFAP